MANLPSGILGGLFKTLRQPSESYNVERRCEAGRAMSRYHQSKTRSPPVGGGERGLRESTPRRKPKATTVKITLLLFINPYGNGTKDKPRASNDDTRGLTLHLPGRPEQRGQRLGTGRRLFRGYGCRNARIIDAVPWYGIKGNDSGVYCS